MNLRARYPDWVIPENNDKKTTYICYPFLLNTNSEVLYYSLPLLAIQASDVLDRF